MVLLGALVDVEAPLGEALSPVPRRHCRSTAEVRQRSQPLRPPAARRGPTWRYRAVINFIAPGRVLPDARLHMNDATMLTTNRRSATNDVVTLTR